MEELPAKAELHDNSEQIATEEKDTKDHDIAEVSNPKLASATRAEGEIDEIRNQIVNLNVGGIFFKTTMSTLMKDPGSFLASVVTDRQHAQKNEDGCIYFDRDGARFKHVLNFLRDGSIPEKVFHKMGEELMVEANFFQMESLQKALDLLTQKKAGSLTGVKDGEKFEEIAEKMDSIIESVQQLREICASNQNEKQLAKDSTKSELGADVEQSIKLHIDESLEKYKKDVRTENANNADEMKDYIRTMIRTALSVAGYHI